MALIDTIIKAGDSGYLWNDTYRIRYMETSKVPYLCQSTLFFGKDLLFIDYAKPKYSFTKNIDSILLEEFDEPYSNYYAQNDDENKENKSDGYDLEGNPLKVTFLTKSMLDGAENDGTFQINYGDLAKQRFPLDCYPLTIEDAMQLSSSISKQSLTGTSPFGMPLEGIPIWIAVDGRNKEHHLMLGLKHHNKNHLLYTTKLLGCGRQIASRLDSLFLHIPSLAGSHTTKYRVRRIAQCVYDIFTHQDSVDNDPTDYIPPKFSVSAKWSLNKDEYLTRPPATTPVMIHFAPGWMDPRLSLYERSVEVSFLMRMTGWLCDQKTAWSGSETQHEIFDKVSTLIEVEQMTKSTSNEHDYDFTEKLWDILKECESAATLSNSFKLIFDKLCNDFSAMVRSDNNSSLAKWLRVSRREDLALPRLEPLTCVQLLAEIGVDRLKRDITTDFLSNNLIQSVTDLQPFFKPNSLPVEERASALLPLHLALQYMVQMELHVGLQSHEKIDITRRVIQRFCNTTLKDPRRECFNFEVTIGCVSERVLTPESLVDWSIVYEYLDGDKHRVRSLVHFAKQVDFCHFSEKMKASQPHVKQIIEGGDNDAAKEGLELADLFYCTVTLASILPCGGILSYGK